MFNNGQAQTGPAKGTAARGINAVEPFKYSGNVFVFDTGALIDYVDNDLIPGAPARYVNHSSLAAVLDCIVDKVSNSLFQQRTIGMNNYIFRTRYLHRYFPAFSGLGKGMSGPLQHLAHRHPVPAHKLLRGFKFDPGEAQQILDN